MHRVCFVPGFLGVLVFHLLTSAALVNVLLFAQARRSIAPVRPEDLPGFKVVAVNTARAGQRTAVLWNYGAIAQNRELEHATTFLLPPDVDELLAANVRGTAAERGRQDSEEGVVLRVAITPLGPDRQGIVLTHSPRDAVFTYWYEASSTEIFPLRARVQHHGDVMAPLALGTLGSAAPCSIAALLRRRRAAPARAGKGRPGRAPRDGRLVTRRHVFRAVHLRSVGYGLQSQTLTPRREAAPPLREHAPREGH